MYKLLDQTNRKVLPPLCVLLSNEQADTYTRFSGEVFNRTDQTENNCSNALTDFQISAMMPSRT